MLIADKEIVLESFFKCAQNGLLDKDYLLVKLQSLILNGDVTTEEIQPIVDVLVI